MKKALKMVLVYLYMVLPGIILGTLIYSLYLSITSYVLGQEFKLFTFMGLTQAFFNVAYICLILICPVMTYYKIRHKGGVAQFIVYICLSLLTWTLFIPGIYMLEKKFNETHMDISEEKILTPGYFRKSENHVYYFTNNKSSIFIDTSENGIVDVMDITLDSDFDLYKNSSPYKEIDIKNNFVQSNSKIPFDIGVIVISAKKALNDSYIYYLGFLSFGLLICSLYVCSYFFGWNLMNSSLLMFLTALAVCMNSIYYGHGFENIRTVVNSTVPFNKMTVFCHEPLLFVVNTIISVAFIIVGIVIFAVQKHKK